MATISLCMIVKDEAPVLARCLESVSPLCDEILIADTGSTDETKAIASRFTGRMFDFPWVDDFAAARNFIFSKARMDYQLWLDADDVLPKKSLEILLELKKNLTADVVMLPYHVAFDAEGNPTCTFWRERLLRRERGFRWEGAVHEAITLSGNILRVDAPVEHRKEHVNDPDRNLRIYETQRREGKTFSPRERFYYARELMWHDRPREAAEEFSAFLHAPDGWSEDKITACLELSRCLVQLGDEASAMQVLGGSFAFGLPRPEVCCAMGGILMQQEKWEEAAYWYDAALHTPAPSGSFADPDCRDVIPYLQLCVCHDRMGNLQRASAYNERAGRIRPQHPAVLANRAYFRKQIG